MLYKVLLDLKVENGKCDYLRLSKLLSNKVNKYATRYNRSVYSIFLENVFSCDGSKPPYKYSHFLFKNGEISLKDSFNDGLLGRISNIKIVCDKSGKLYIGIYVNENIYYIYKLLILSNSNYDKVVGKGLGYNIGAINKLPQLKLESKNKVILDFNKVYNASGSVYEQHNLDVCILEFTMDKGVSWKDVPVDLGKIDYMSAVYRLKYC